MSIENTARFSSNYAFTITLQPKLYIHEFEQQFQLSYSEIINCLNNHKISIVIEPTQSYNLHYHGLISFNLTKLGKHKNVIRYFCDIFRKSQVIGHVLCKPIDNEIGWIEYVIKDITKQHTHLRPIRRDDLNVFEPCSDEYKFETL